MDNDSLFALKVYYEDEYQNEYDIIRMLKIELINQGMEENEVNIKLKDFYDNYGLNIDLKVFKNIKIRNNYQIINSIVINAINELNNNAINELNNNTINELNNNDNTEDDNIEYDNTEDDNTEDDNSEDNNSEDNNDENDNTEDDNTENNNDENENNNIITNFLIFDTFTNNTTNYINNIVNHTEDVISTLNEEDKNNLKKYILEKNLEDKCSICIDCMISEQEIIELPCTHKYHSNCINEYLTNYSYKCPCCKKEVGRPVHNI
jgi:hypothetical protein